MCMKNFWNKLFVKKSFLIKYAILGALENYYKEVTSSYDSDEQVYPMDVSLTIEDLVLKTGYKANEISDQIDYLIYRRLIEDHFNNPEYFYSITPFGKLNLKQKLYISEGRKNTWTIIKEVSALFISIGLFILAFCTFYVNYSSTKENEKGIKLLNRKLDSALISKSIINAVKDSSMKYQSIHNKKK